MRLRVTYGPRLMVLHRAPDSHRGPMCGADILGTVLYERRPKDWESGKRPGINEYLTCWECFRAPAKGVDDDHV